MTAAISTWAKRKILTAGSALLDVLLPPQCLGCRRLVDRPGQLCPDCWGRIRFIAPPFCACCGLPFGRDEGAGTLCPSCIAEPPLFEHARSVFVYDEHSRDLVLSFKHADRTERSVPYGRWLARAAIDLTADCDLVVPVPLHRWRLWRRRYNQSALLALAVARETGRPAAVDLLIRPRATPTQGGLGREARRRNVAGAIALRPGRTVTGLRILLIDDVFTTGATVTACARVLLRAGAARVDVLTLARVVRDDDRSI